MGIVKTAILGFLILSPCVFTFTLPETKSEVEARQFHDEPLINYGIWGFIAGLSDYFIRNGVNTMATATTTTTTTASTRKRSKNKNKKHKKEKRNKRKQDRISEAAEMEMEVVDAVVEDVPAEVVDEAVVEETVEA